MNPFPYLKKKKKASFLHTKNKRKDNIKKWLSRMSDFINVAELGGSVRTVLFIQANKDARKTTLPVQTFCTHCPCQSIIWNMSFVSYRNSSLRDIKILLQIEFWRITKKGELLISEDLGNYIEDGFNWMQFLTPKS